MGKTEKTANAALVRVHKVKNYTVMSNKHLFDKPPLSLKAKGLLCMFLALPDNWNYSINGLVAICKESRDAIKSTLDELKKFGYLHIEKIMPSESGTGRIEYIYHIFEEKNGEDLAAKANQKQEGENTPLEILEKQEGEKQALEKQALENQALENPIQINIKEINTNEQNTNNETLIENVNIFGALELFNLYKQICITFSQPRELSDERKDKANKRLKKFPNKDFWETVFNKANKSTFIKKSNFFTFDWVLKNNLNALKVFEGNYDDGTFKTKQTYSDNSGVVHLSKYSNYHNKQEQTKEAL